jgi:hypothetical protein
VQYEFEAFLAWVRSGLAPLPDDFDCYDVADRICILHTLGESAVAKDWLTHFDQFRTADGLYVEGTPTHHPWHTTAFVIAAMQLCGRRPEAPAAFDDYRDRARAVAFLDSLDWEHSVYGGSHEGSALCSIAAIAPGYADAGWFDAVFSALDAKIDPANGMMGTAKPARGDLDQIGGTFHYHFVYEHFGRRLPCAEARIDAVLGLQQPDGIWHSMNPVWLTLDAVYLMTRSVRDAEHRRRDIEAAMHAVLEHYRREICVPEFFREPLAAHSCTAVVSLLAEAQRFLGADIVRTERPLRLVLDERPFI